MYGINNCDDNNEESVNSDNQIDNNNDIINISSDNDNDNIDINSNSNTNKKRKKIITFSAVAASVALLAVALWAGVFANAFDSGNSFLPSAKAASSPDNNSTLPGSDDTESGSDQSGDDTLQDNDQTDNTDNSTKDPTTDSGSTDNPTTNNPPSISASDLWGQWFCDDERLLITLFSNGTYKRIPDYGIRLKDYPGKYSFSNNTLSFTPDDENDSPFSYPIKNYETNKLTLVINGVECTFRNISNN
jgi:hypothetical protein